MPVIYAPPSYKKSLVPPQHTICRVFVGKGTPFDGREGLRLTPDVFPHGMSNTLLFVEAGEPVPWTKPEELPYDPEGPLPSLRGLFNDGFRACMADASRRFVKYDVREETLWAAITRNGEKEIGLDW